MDDVLLMYGSQPSQDLSKDVDCLGVAEDLIGECVLVGVEVAELAVLHDEEDGL
jgi:hypothetical protein